MAIKNRANELMAEAKKQFAEATKEIEKTNSLDQSLTELKDLTNDELLDRLEQVENQAVLIKWRIWWTIRQRFDSDKLFGQYIASLRNDPTHALCVGSQQDINRALNAGRFCEKHKINDLTKIGVSQTAIYVLSRPANNDVADKIYKEVKDKGYQVVEVERRIAQAKAVTTIEPERMDYEPKKVEQRKIVDDEKAALFQVIEEEEQRQQAVAENATTTTHVAISRDGSDKYDFTRITSHIPSDEDVIADIKDFVMASLAKRQSLSKIKIFKALTDWLANEIKSEQGNVYPKS